MSKHNNIGLGIYFRKILDGIGSAAILKHFYPNIELIGYDYGEFFVINFFRKKEVLMVNVSSQ